MRLQKIVLASCLTVVFMLMLGLSLQSAEPAYADGGCTTTYTVRWGDTLYSIDRRFDTSVSELLRLNYGRIHNPNRIYAGQVLCLPTPATSTPVPSVDRTTTQPVAATKSQVAIEVAYQYIPSAETGESGFNLTSRGGYVGKRLVYPLQPINSVTLMTRTAEMAAAIRDQPAPVLLAVRNFPEAMTYTLVYVGEGPPLLSSLRISETKPITIQPGCNSTAVAEALGGENIQDAQVTLWLEAQEHGTVLRYPFSITHLDHMPDAGWAAMCYADDIVGVALLPADSGQADLYRNLTLLRHTGELGPVGYNRSANCWRWRGRGSYFYRWLNTWYGCPR